MLKTLEFRFMIFVNRPIILISYKEETILKKGNFVDSYCVTRNTYMIEPIHLDNNKTYSRVYDKGGEVLVSQSPLKIIKESCKNMSINYHAARQFAKEFFGEEKHKLPISISYANGFPCVFFPLLSPDSSDNCWIGLHAIINFKKVKNCTEITLKDGRELTLQVHSSSFSSQYVYSTMFQIYIKNKRQEIQNDFPFY